MIYYDPGLNPLDFANRALLAHAGFAEATVESAAGPQTYFAAGAGEPIALLHGAGDHAGSWSKVAPALTGRFRVLVPDLAGRGASAPHQGRITMTAMLAGLDAVLAGAGRLTLVGNSLGAWVAMVWAAAHLERVARIVAVNGGPIRGIRPDLSLTPSNREEARRLWQAMMDESNHQVPDFVLDELIRKGTAGALGRMGLEDCQDYLMEGRLDAITAPVDLLWGGSDQLVPLEYARALLAGLPCARLTVIPGCGHVPHLECPERFNDALRGILDRTP